MSSRLRVALVHHLDVLDPLTWSGTPRALLRALRRRGVEVLPVSPLDRATSEQDLRRHARYAREGQLYHLDSTPRAVAGYARQVERAARDLNPDVILGVNPIALADLNVKTPVVLWTDATYALLHDTYPSFTRVCAESVVRGWQVDASALARCSLTLYSSEWAARSAREDLGVPAELVGVVPYGANLDEPPARQDALSALARRGRETLRLLWIGVDWHRKGGDTAVAALRALRARGVRVSLTMVGAVPGVDLREEPGLRIEPFARKETPEGRARLDALLAASHVLVLPSRADCTPMVAAEAAAFAVPTVAARVGGMSSVVREGESGVLLPAHAGGEAYADALERLWTAPAELDRRSRASRDLYDELLDWDVATRGLLDRLTGVLGGDGRPAGLVSARD